MPQAVGAAAILTWRPSTTVTKLPCRRAKTWFAGQRLNVTDYDVDHDSQAKRALVQYNPRGSLPTSRFRASDLFPERYKTE